MRHLARVAFFLSGIAGLTFEIVWSRYLGLAMGATLPILARAVTHHIGHVGREVGLLYAVNTAGAVVGAALSGFVWLPAFGHTMTNGIAVGLDVGLGTVAVLAGLLFAPRATSGSTDTYADADGAPLLAPGGQWLVGLLAVTGAAAMALQVLWTRAIALGPSTYAFSAILCAYLCGLAIGGALASRSADRTESSRFYLCLVMLATGTFAFIGIAWVDDLPLMLRSVVLDRGLTPAALMRAELLIASVSLLPATLCMGAIFPLTLGAVVGSSAKLGAAVGRAYAVNTVGAIFGSFAAVFVLLPAARQALDDAAAALPGDADQRNAIAYYQAKEAFEAGEYARAATKMREYGLLSKRLSAAPEGD